MVVLIRHFLSRFLRNPLLSENGDFSIALVEIVAPLAVIGGLTCFLTLQRRFFLSFIGEQIDPSWLWVNESFYVSFAMILTGLATLLEWDELFLDATDFTNLGSLPIRLPVLFLAKIVSLLLFVGLVSCGANAFSALLFPGLMSTGGAVSSNLWWIIVHGGVLFLACLAVFNVCLGIQGLVLFLPGLRLFQLASLIFRWLLAVVLLTGLAALPQIHAALPVWKANESPGLWFFPPMWFAGLYQVLLGQGDAAFSFLAGMALSALAGGVLVVAVAYGLQYRRYAAGSSGAWHTMAGVGRRKRTFWRLSAAAVRDPRERAVFQFIAQTIFRRQKQLLVWAGFSGLGLAFLAASWGRLHLNVGAAGLENPNWLSLTFVHLLVFFSLVGMRVAFSLPVQVEANWAFRITGEPDARRCFLGVRKAVIVFGALPPIALGFLIHIGPWGWAAVAHSVYAFTLALILFESLFFSFRKVPFTCPFAPEKVNVKLMWPFYLGGFGVCVYGGALLESWLLRNTGRFAAGQGLLAAVVVVWRCLRRRLRADGDDRVVYEEKAEPAVVRLQLN